MSARSPITALLEEEVKRELRERAIVVWLDRDGSYTSYVDALAERHARGDFFAPVVRFRGSYLDAMLALEDHCNGQDPDPLLLHLPGHTEETVRKTPLLEVYRAGFRFRKALTTLVHEAARGTVGPAEIDAFLESEVVTLEGAEAWLAERAARERGGLSGQLEGLTLEWCVDALLGADPHLRKDVEKTSDGPAILADHLYRHTGMGAAFLDFFLSGEARTARTVSEAFAAWLLCVEYVHDLARAPLVEALKPVSDLQRGVRERCLQLVRHLRERHPDEYARYADQAEQHLAEELAGIAPADLGSVDTFRKEEQVLLEAAVAALAEGRWSEASEWARPREAGSFWLQRDPLRRMAWSLVRSGGELGERLAASARPLNGVDSLREALDIYTRSAFEVDSAHRHFEQERLRRLGPQLPHFAMLLQAADRLRATYRTWADTLGVDLNAICQREGFLPEADLQQRTIYEQVVHPLTQQGESRVAYFLIDAFRYEMATEVVAELAGAGARVSLKGRYAELPSITAVGMNALAPVCQGGRLVLAGNGGFNGFRAGEFTVRTPDERIRAMGERSVDPSGERKRRWLSLKLGEVCNKSPEDLQKALREMRLVVVHSKEIDDAGEADVGLATFDTWLSQIKSAWHHLRNAGVNEFVFTADHGFLLQDQTAEVKRYGDNPCRRHVLSADLRAEDGLVGVSLNDLGYEGREGWLLFRKDTALFDTGVRGATFVHGGNSLQERVIPVLHASLRVKPAAVQADFEIEAVPLQDLLGLSRLSLRLRPASLFSVVGTRTVDLGLRVPGRDDVRVVIKEAVGAQQVNQALRIPVEGDAAEVLFTLEGPAEERVRVQVFHPDATHNVPEVEVPVFFAVRRVAGASQAEAPPAGTGDWRATLADAGVRDVFDHLHAHGSITETELIGKLGSPRAVRRFSASFDAYLGQVPFSVHVESTESGKRYVKQ